MAQQASLSLEHMLTLFVLLDMDEDLMQVRFDEIVDISSVNYSQFSLRSGPTGDSSAVTIGSTGGMSIHYVTEIDIYRRLVEIAFNAEDIPAIKTQPAIATSRANSYLELGAGAIEDTAGNSNMPTSAAFQVDDHMQDTRGPELLSFVLDLDSNTLSFTFNDIVDIMTLDVTQITLQPRRINFFIHFDRFIQ